MTINKQALRERYSEKPAPKCHICGAVMTIQRAGSGGVVYGCTGRIDKDGESYKFETGRDFADDHYARSRVTDYSPSGDPDVLTLLDELEAAEKRIAELVHNHRVHAARLIDERGQLKQRIAELEAREVNLPDINKYLSDVTEPTLDRALRLTAKGVRSGDVAAIRAAGISIKGE